jgi:hypothetical protein
MNCALNWKRLDWNPARLMNTRYTLQLGKHAKWIILILPLYLQALYEQKKQQLAEVQEKRKKVAAETAAMKQRLAKLNVGVEDNDADLEKLRKSSILYIKEKVNSHSLGRKLEYST